jgi:predicted O-methyltransferase YrrM
MYKFTENTDWFTPHISLFTKMLNNYKDLPYHFLEIGTFEGRSTLWMLENILIHSESTITCIDKWDCTHENYENVYVNFIHNMLVGGFMDRIEFYKMESNTALKLPQILSKKYDFIYIDANHSTPHPLEDAVLSFPLLKTNGILAFDDYLWDVDKSITKCIDSFLLCYEPFIKIIHKGYQVWIKRL